MYRFIKIDSLPPKRAQTPWDHAGSQHSGRGDSNFDMGVRDRKHSDDGNASGSHPLFHLPLEFSINLSKGSLRVSSCFTEGMLLKIVLKSSDYFKVIKLCLFVVTLIF